MARQGGFLPAAVAPIHRVDNVWIVPTFVDMIALLRHTARRFSRAGHLHAGR
jgi:hypothetical protein